MAAQQSTLLARPESRQPVLNLAISLRPNMFPLDRLRDIGADDDDAYGHGGFGAVPASGEAMAALPKSTAAGDKSHQAKGRAEECVLCMEGYVAGEALRTMPCSHEFHEGCIVDWLRVSRTCPLCRFKLPAETEDEEYEEDVDHVLMEALQFISRRSS